MFAGVMMTAVHKSMDGYGGLPGWKWVFLIGKSGGIPGDICFLLARLGTKRVIDGIITLPVAAAGFVCFPDIPEQTKAKLFSLKEDDIKLAIKRLPPKREDAHNVSPLSLAKRILGKPYLYATLLPCSLAPLLTRQVTSSEYFRLLLARSRPFVCNRFSFFG